VSRASAPKVLVWPYDPADKNPYTRMIYADCPPRGIKVIPFRPLRRLRWPADIVHLHWPEMIFWGRGATSPLAARLVAANLLSVIRAVRKRGGKLILTAHNITPHAPGAAWQQRIWRSYLPKLLGLTDLVMGLSETSAALYAEHHQLPATLARAIIPHPHYRGSYPAPPSREAARAKLGLPEGRIVGMIGLVRHAKNIPAAIEAFIPARAEGEYLLVAGEGIEPGCWDRIRQAAGASSGILLREQPIPDALLPTFFAACDMILYNQATALNSGSAMLALSMDRPVIAPALPALIELAASIGSEWLTTFPAPLNTRELRANIDLLAAMARQPEAPLQSFSPAQIARKTADMLVALGEGRLP
jgi:glycosyltransferase involved in cell wall biosynthesis